MGMRYVGSKKRLAKEILSEIEARRGSRDVYWEPFAGGLNSFSIIAPHFGRSYASDTNEDVILMWSALYDGSWSPPETMTPETYASLKEAPASPLRGFAGTGCSYGGKWFRGYARGGFNAGGVPRNYVAESGRAVIKDMGLIKGFTEASFKYAPFHTGSASSRMVVYCDPPYAGTLGYSGSSHEFDHGMFWSWAEKQSSTGALVMVSEYEAPPGWTCIREFDHRMNVSSAGNRRATVERLFVQGEM